LPAHEFLGGVSDRIIRVVLREQPLARVLGRLEAEGALLGADDEAAILQDAQQTTCGGQADVKPYGLAHRIGNAAVVAAVVAARQLGVESARTNGKAFPRRRVE